MLGVAIFTIFAAAAPEVAAQPAPAVAATPVDPSQKIRCRTEQVTGSIAQHRKTCLTVAEWRKRDGDAVTNAERIVDAGLIKPTNGQ